MISLLSLAKLVAFEFPVMVHTVPCVRFTVLALPPWVEITPRKVEPCALNSVVLPDVVSSSVLLLVTAIVLLRLMLAVAP